MAGAGAASGPWAAQAKAAWPRITDWRAEAAAERRRTAAVMGAAAGPARGFVFGEGGGCEVSCKNKTLVVGRRLGVMGWA